MLVSFNFPKKRSSFLCTSRKINLLPEVKSSHVLWIAISLTDKQIMHLPSDHVSKIYSYHFLDTRTRSTIRSGDRFQSIVERNVFILLITRCAGVKIIISRNFE